MKAIQALGASVYPEEGSDGLGRRLYFSPVALWMCSRPLEAAS
jgi:hypothetical protein